MSDRPESPIQPPDAYDWDALADMPPQEEETAPRRKAVRRAKVSVAALNITSFLDMSFCLLTFLILSASFIGAEGSLAANLPKGNIHVESAGPADEGGEQVIVIRLYEMGKACRIRIEGYNEAPVDFKALSAKLKDMQSVYKPTDEVRIVPEKGVAWQHVVNAFNAATRARYSKITFAGAQ